MSILIFFDYCNGVGRCVMIQKSLTLSNTYTEMESCLSPSIKRESRLHCYTRVTPLPLIWLTLVHSETRTLVLKQGMRPEQKERERDDNSQVSRLCMEKTKDGCQRLAAGFYGCYFRWEASLKGELSKGFYTALLCSDTYCTL